MTMFRAATASLGLVAAFALPAHAAGTVAKRGIDRDGARAVIDAAFATAGRLGAPGAAVAVVDEGGNLVAVERRDGTFAAGAEIAAGKARTAARFHKPTRVFEEAINTGRTAMAALSDFVPLQGGVPIEVDGAVVGAVGVSGAASAQQDDEIASAAATALSAALSGGEVRYYPSAAVTAAFAKGDVLYDGAGGANYMVHASRRDAAGKAEVHALDTDVIYVVDGVATLVTGGSVVDPETVSANEVRGAAIRDGQARRLARGDVVIVPARTPHWFREVPGPFTYFVVKVR
jgi:glc operon protein GlcG